MQGHFNLSRLWPHAEQETEKRADQGSPVASLVAGHDLQRRRQNGLSSASGDSVRFYCYGWLA